MKAATVTKIVNSLDAQRRVGWAKWFDEVASHKETRYLAMHRLGMVLGILERANEIALPKAAAEKLIEVVVEETIRESEDRIAVGEGRFNAGVVIARRWGDMQTALQEMLGNIETKLGAEEHETFKAIVEADLHDPNPMLRSPENLQRWREMLGLLNTKMCHQFATRSAGVDDLKQKLIRRFGPGSPVGKQHLEEAQSEYNSWKAKALGYQRLVAERLQECKNLIREQTDKQNLNGCRALRDAVYNHRVLSMRNGREPTPEDMKLWVAYDELCQPSVAQYDGEVRP